MHKMIVDNTTLEMHDGVWFPADCGKKWKASVTRTHGLHAVIDICKAKNRLRTAVQAGGSMGIWPRELANYFQKVYTFEPEPMSFACLCKNVEAENVIALPWAVGMNRKMVSVKRKSLTSHHIVEGRDVGQILIDDLELEYCDALLLDVEGMELEALQGASLTIENNRPVILVEALHNIDGIEYFLQDFGYRLSARVRTDRIYEAD